MRKREISFKGNFGDKIVFRGLNLKSFSSDDSSRLIHSHEIEEQLMDFFNEFAPAKKITHHTI